jgi:hypothetical protein
MGALRDGCESRTGNLKDGAQDTSERLAEAYEQTARVLDHSAALAASHARRHAQAGQSRAAEGEDRMADRARKAAQRASRAAKRAREIGSGVVAAAPTTASDQLEELRRRLASTYERVADALERSAALADERERRAN